MSVTDSGQLHIQMVINTKVIGKMTKNRDRGHITIKTEVNLWVSSRMENNTAEELITTAKEARFKGFGWQVN